MEKDLKQVIDAAVSRALESQLPPLREELVKRVLEDIGPALAAGIPAAASANGTGQLLEAVTSIQLGGTQKEILRALLDASIGYCGRAALFVIKSGTATGWQGRGFNNDEEIKDFSLDVVSGAAEKVLESREVVGCRPEEIDPEFISTFGVPAESRVLLLPLRVKDKVAALVYGDSGADARMDEASLQLLVASAGAWLEVISLRKQAHKDGFGEAEPREASVAAQTVTSFSDPFAGHAPAFAGAKATAPVMETAAVATATGAGAAVAPALDPAAQMSPEDADVHRKAQRFARLLIDEIKLYNQAKVAEGRKKKDLYDRLKEDIEKSRAAYQKRYGNTAAASADYVTQEILRSLAEDDASVMGGNFHR